MLYAAGVPDRETMQNAPHVGIASVWYVFSPVKTIRVLIMIGGKETLASKLSTHFP